MPYIMLNGKQYGGNGGNYQVAKMSKADYDALSTSQKNDGTLRIVVDSGGNSVNYLSETVAGARRDDVLTNLLNPTLATTTVNGITCTNNGDGTYTLKGTATANTTIVLRASSDINVTSGQTVKLVGCPSGGSGSTYALYTQSIHYQDLGDGVVFDWDSGITGIAIYVGNGTALPTEGLTFKPMLTTDLTATYDDFVGYTGGTGRLNSDVALHQRQISRINTDLNDMSVATNSPNVSGTFYYAKVGNIVVGAGDITITSNLPAYSSLVTGLPKSKTPAVMGAFITDSAGYNSVYVSVNSIVTRNAINSGTMLRLSCVYLAE